MPVDFEKIAKQLDHTLRIYPPIPASSKLPFIALSVLNFTSPMEGGFQTNLDCFTLLQFRNLKFKGQLANSVTVILEVGQFPLHHQAK
ncbi:hypothetical protein V6N13_015051 [Hibiscus sabdariffa]